MPVVVPAQTTQRLHGHRPQRITFDFEHSSWQMLQRSVTPTLLSCNPPVIRADAADSGSERQLGHQHMVPSNSRWTRVA